jgi:pyridoxal phosphate enzyme (YggS family)
MDSIRDNVMRARERVAAALERAGRPDDHVTLVGVTKTWGADMVDALVEAGVEDVGENRIQEFLEKQGHVSRKCRWHMIGHLQRNKAVKAVGQFHCIQSFDSLRIAETLDRLGRERGVTTRALLQVNTSGESSKHGFAEESAEAGAAEIASLDAVDIEGLMTIGPVTMDPDETRRCFRRLFALRQKIRRSTGLALPELSMGMSGDFEMAIEEGATVVRLGTVLTGTRSR